MAESTLAAPWQDLQARVASQLGWGRGQLIYGDKAWTDKQQFDLDGIVRSGLSRVYRPDPLPGERTSHDWSFLKPVATLSVDAAANTLPLPDDFGGMEGQVTLSATTQIAWYPLDFTTIGRVYNQQSLYPTSIGRPMMICVEPLRGTTATQGQRWQARLWPITDQAYTVQFQYYVLGDMLSGAFPYAYGGAALSEVLLESCLAVAEQRLDQKIDGPHSIMFSRLLAAAVNNDRRSKPQKIGYNRDQSDLMERDWDRIDQHGISQIQIGGQVY